MACGLRRRRREYRAARRVAAQIARDEIRRIAPLGRDAILEAYDEEGVLRVHTGVDGREYQVKVETMRHRDEVHLIVVVDDGGLMALFPPTEGVDIPPSP